MAFETPLGFWAFLSLIPFIILYLRKPKPKEQQIPSLMFLVKQEKRSKRFSFFQRFTSNFLFFLQLLILSLLALALATPTINLAYDVTKENTVLIVDASGSMNALDGSKTRFERAIDEATSYLSGRNTIIMAESSPLIVLEDESSDIARDVLNKLQPKATSTNLGDALLLAKDILGERSGSIIIFSDFLITEGPDVEIVKTSVEDEDVIVSFVPIGRDVDNVGIISMSVGKFDSNVRIKNFEDETKTVQISIEQDGNQIATSGDIVISPFSIEPFEFSTPAGQSVVKVTPDDDFSLDNQAFVATPDKTTYDILIITNEQNTNPALALGATPLFDVTVVNPPVLTIDVDGNRVDPYAHDAIILYRVDAANILPGTFKDIEEFVNRGGSFVYAAQPDMSGLELRDLQLVALEGVQNNAAQICVDTTVSITKQFSGQPCFTSVSRYFSGSLEEQTVSLASAANSPILAIKELGLGSVAYYGILDEYSDFSSLPSYPVFWFDLLTNMIGVEDILTYNFKSGTIVSFDEQDITTPTQTIKTSKLLLDEQGLYEFGGRTVAVNLLNQEESDVSTTADSDATVTRSELLDAETRTHDFSLVWALSALLLLLILFEFYYIKRRGDL